MAYRDRLDRVLAVVLVIAAAAYIGWKITESPEQAVQFLAQSSPQQRLIEPDEIAATVDYLLSDDARGLHGQAIVIDGGAVTL